MDSSICIDIQDFTESSKEKFKLQKLSQNFHLTLFALQDQLPLEDW